MTTPTRPLFLSVLLAAVTAMPLVACNKASESTGSAPPPISVGTEVDDSVVTASVKSALLADPDVKSLDLKVETRKGEVQLSGFVDDQKQIDRALGVTRGVAGVRHIENNIALKGSGTTIGNKIDDTTITAQVKSALLADDSVKSFDISVVTRKGEVQLSGFVDNQSQMDRAIAVARGVEGVQGVSNQTSIKK